jgi:hypothetical protein
VTALLPCPTAAAGGARGWALGAAAALYVASVLLLVYLLCRRIILHKERYGLTYQRVKVGAGSRQPASHRPISLAPAAAVALALLLQSALFLCPPLAIGKQQLRPLRG